MPQLMPLFWVDSLLMIFYVLLSLLIFYCFKSNEVVMKEIINVGKSYTKYNFVW